MTPPSLGGTTGPIFKTLPVSMSSVSLRGVRDGDGRAELGVQGPANKLIHLFHDIQ